MMTITHNNFNPMQVHKSTIRNDVLILGTKQIFDCVENIANELNCQKTTDIINHIPTQPLNFNLREQTFSIPGIEHPGYFTNLMIDTNIISFISPLSIEREWIGPSHVNTKYSKIELHELFKDDFFPVDTNLPDKIAELRASIKYEIACSLLKDKLLQLTKPLLNILNKQAASDIKSSWSLEQHPSSPPPSAPISPLLGRVDHTDGQIYVPDIPATVFPIRFNNIHFDGARQNHFNLSKEHKNTFYQFFRKIAATPPENLEQYFLNKQLDDSQRAFKVLNATKQKRAPIKSHTWQLILDFGSNIGIDITREDIPKADILFGCRPGRTTVSPIINPVNIHSSQNLPPHDMRRIFMTPSNTHVIAVTLTYCHAHHNSSEYFVNAMHPIKYPDTLPAHITDKMPSTPIDSHLFLKQLHNNTDYSWLWKQEPITQLKYFKRLINQINPQPISQTIPLAFFS
jgi:hypothetical protein